MCSLILKPIPCLQNESISLTSIVKFILKITHTSQKIMFHLLCFKWGRGGGYTTPSTPPSKVLYFLAMSNHPHLMLHVTCVCLLLWLISNTLKNFFVSKLNPILNIPQIIFQIILPLPENSFYRLYFNYYYTSMNINTSASHHSNYVICIISWKATKNINISFSFTNNISFLMRAIQIWCRRRLWLDYEIPINIYIIIIRLVYFQQVLN